MELEHKDFLRSNSLKSKPFLIEEQRFWLNSNPEPLKPGEGTDDRRFNYLHLTGGERGLCSFIKQLIIASQADKINTGTHSAPRYLSTFDLISWQK